MSLKDELQYNPEELAFGTSGLRGLVIDMTDLECYINALGFLKFLEKNNQLRGSVYVAGDLRQSTPRIIRAVMRAATDANQTIISGGFVPTPALALAGLIHECPAIMVTGSHIPDDRNGIKFYKPDGEVLKEDEAGIKESVHAVRMSIYDQRTEESAFDSTGTLKESSTIPPLDPSISQLYMERFTSLFPSDIFQGKQVIVYQHSAVGRDMLSELFAALGAEVVNVGRSDIFIPIDTENVTSKDQAYFKQLAAEYPNCFAIISTDGDSDRPFVVDELGVFHRGDELGAIVANTLKADFAAYPISTSDSVDTFLAEKGIANSHTRIGSPYVIQAMSQAAAEGSKRVVGWEVNGGFMTGNDFMVANGNLRKLPTRDAFFPIIMALYTAVLAGKKISNIFLELPKRFSQAGLIDNFLAETSKSILIKYQDDSDQNKSELNEVFSPAHGFGTLEKINSLDGIRMYFDNGDIAHIRPSGNAPQLRIYSVANSQERADAIVSLALAEPDGLLRRLEKSVVL